jgi:hypothetical protein
MVRDWLEEELDQLLPHIEDSLRNGDFNMEERTLDTYSVAELKDYIRSIYAIPLSRFTGVDRQNLQEAVKLLAALGYEKILRPGHKVVFRKKQS